MKRKLYNTIVFSFFVANIFAQKTDKKYTEKFYTNKNVEIVLNASNTHVEVQNWNKNEILVEASIEVEGVSKKEAQKYIDKWRFEALGNKSKVRINANGSGHFGFGNDDFVLFNNYPKAERQLREFTNGSSTVFGDSIFISTRDGIKLNRKAKLCFPHKLQDLPATKVTSHTLNGNVFLNDYTYLGMGSIILPDLEVFEFPSSQANNLFNNFDKLSFDTKELKRNDEDYVYRWSNNKKEIKIKTRKEWERFKKTKEYKRLRKTMKDGKKIAKAQKQLLKEYEKAEGSKGIGGMYLKNISSNFWFPNIHGDMIFTDIDNVDFDFDKYSQDGDDYFFKWKDSIKIVDINSKKAWEKFKKSKEYKKLKKELKPVKEKYLKEKEQKQKLRKFKSNKLSSNSKSGIYVWDNNNKNYFFIGENSMLKTTTPTIINLRGTERIHKKQGKLVTSYFYDNDKETRKVKIKKKIIIKVPKEATFSLNTRHCKLNLANVAVSGKTSYGILNATGLIGGSLRVNSVNEVNIKYLNACTLFVNNSSLVNIEKLSKANLTVNSSNVNIDEIHQGATINNKFGDTKVYNINPNFKDLKINLMNSSINLPLKKINTNFDVDFVRSKFQFVNGTKLQQNKIFKVLNNKEISVKSKINASKKTKNNIVIKGKYASVTIF